MSEEPANGEKKVIIRRVVRRESNNFLGIDSDTIHWLLTGAALLGVGCLVANEYAKRQQQAEQDKYLAEMEAKAQAEANAAAVEQVPVQPPQPQQPENIYPDRMSNNIPGSTLDDSSSQTYVVDADGTRRRIRSRFGDQINIA